jgi:roadblock/LC7 domain-containing protein
MKIAMAAAHFHDSWVPQHGWAYSGGEWTACIGDGGNRGVFVETSKAGFNRLFEVSGDER